MKKKVTKKLMLEKLRVSSLSAPAGSMVKGGVATQPLSLCICVDTLWTATKVRSVCICGWETEQC